MIKNVAIYHPWIYLRGGAERVILEYARNSKHNVTVITSYFSPYSTFQEYQSMLSEGKLIVLNDKVSVKRNLSNIVKSYLSLIFSDCSCLSGYDGLIISSEGVGDFWSIGNVSIPTVAYCHTPLKIIYDQHTADNLKKRFGYSIKIPYYLLSGFYRYINKIIWRRYSFVMTNSNETKKRILKSNLCSSNNIEVIYPGASIPQSSLDIKKNKNYKKIIIAGRIMWQKNIEIGILAFSKIYQSNSDIRLSIVGAVDDKSLSYLESLKLLVEKLGISNQVDFIINPNDHLMNLEYATSDILIFTPQNEDWGIVPVEAMSYGIPVVAFNNGGPAESVLNGLTGILCTEYTANSFATSVVELMEIEDQITLRNQCIARSADFSWKSYAYKIDAVVDKYF